MASYTKIGDRWRVQLGPKHGRIAKTFRTKAQCERWEREVIEGGSNTKIKVKELIQAYRDAHAEAGNPIDPKSNEHYMLLHLETDLGDEVAMELDTAKLLKWAQKRTAGGAGPVALNMELSKLGTVMRHTASLKNLRLPDVAGQARPTLRHYGLIANAKKRTRRPSADEQAAICEWFREHPEYDIPMEDIVNVLCQSIMRRGEIFRITWDDLAEKARGVWVRDRKHPRKKKGNDEFVLLVGTSWDIIQRQPNRKPAESRIFPYNPGTVSKYFKWACDANGIVDLHLHDCKREATSSLADLGLTPQEITAAGGPKKWEVQQRYTELEPAKLSAKIINLKTGT